MAKWTYKERLYIKQVLFDGVSGTNGDAFSASGACAWINNRFIPEHADGANGTNADASSAAQTCFLIDLKFTCVFFADLFPLKEGSAVGTSYFIARDSATMRSCISAAFAYAIALNAESKILSVSSISAIVKHI